MEQPVGIKLRILGRGNNGTATWHSVEGFLDVSRSMVGRDLSCPPTASAALTNTQTAPLSHCQARKRHGMSCPTTGWNCTSWLWESSPPNRRDEVELWRRRDVACHVHPLDFRPLTKAKTLRFNTDNS